MLNKGIKKGLKMMKGMGQMSNMDMKLVKSATPSLRGRASKKYGKMPGMKMLETVTKSKIKKFL